MSPCVAVPSGGFVARSEETYYSSRRPTGTMSDTGLRPTEAGATLPDPATADDVVYDPSPEWLRERARPEETTTEFGSAAYVSDQRSRRADRTKNAVDDHERRAYLASFDDLDEDIVGAVY